MAAMRNDETDTVFYECKTPLDVLRVAIQVVGPGFHPDDDPADYVDADGLPVFDEMDCGDIDDALAILLQNDDFDPYAFTLAVLAEA